MYVKEF